MTTKLSRAQVGALRDDGFHFATRGLGGSGAVPVDARKSGGVILYCPMPHRSSGHRTAEPRRGLAMHFVGARIAEPDMLRILAEGATALLRGAAGRALESAG